VSVLTGIDGDLTRRPDYRLFDDLDIGVMLNDLAQQRDTAAGQDAFLDCGGGRMRAADADHRDAAGQALPAGVVIRHRSATRGCFP